MKLNTNISPLYRNLIFWALLLFCLTSFIDAPKALLLGFIIAQTIGHPFHQYNARYTSLLLKISVVGLGFGINLTHALSVGKGGLLITAFSILITLLFGLLLGRILKVDSKISYLLSGGTAICGGSAIAALAPIIKADEKQISVALGAIFILNSIALLLFPILGHLLDMSEHQFGLWCAIAIHDTSSVVGAASHYGSEALQIATTIKLERALWIIPLSLITAVVTKGENRKMVIPYFIGFFILAMCMSSYMPEYAEVYSSIVGLSKKGLSVTLFLIGAGLSLQNMKIVGLKPFVQSVLLWVFISVASLLIILWKG